LENHSLVSFDIFSKVFHIQKEITKLTMYNPRGKLFLME